LRLSIIDDKPGCIMNRNSLRYLVPACLGFVLAAAIWAQTPTPTPSEADSKAWQHLAFEHDGGSVTGDRELGRKINELGRGGWELVDVETVTEAGTTSKTVFYFKKPL
jgi:hypothetical protein